MPLLPKKESTEELHAALKTLDFTELYRARTRELVFMFLPEFRYSFEDNMTDWYKSLGIREIFSDHADFSPLSSAWLKMDFIIHKARIEVDRNGTKAAAVTLGLVAPGGGPPPDYRIVELNRPFVYAIIHTKTGLPVFTGIVNRL